MEWRWRWRSCTSIRDAHPEGDNASMPLRADMHSCVPAAALLIPCVLSLSFFLHLPPTVLCRPARTWSTTLWVSLRHCQ